MLCKNIFPLNDDNFFRNNQEYQGGFGWFCKPCKRVNARKYYNNTPLKNRFEFLKKFNFTCQYCGRKAPEIQFHIDHILPLSGGGGSNLDNLILACDDCNIGKGDKKL